VLPTQNRLRESQGFRDAVRQGRRHGSKTVVVHLTSSDGPEPLRVGFVVSKAVGNAVVRNRVKRQLRHLVRDLLLEGEDPGSGVLVVRAQPGAATASPADLRADLVRCLQRASAA